MRWSPWWATAGVMVLVAGCGPKSAATGAEPTMEFICLGRGSVGDIRERVDATNRDEAIKKFRDKHSDVVAPTCTPNPR
jgi:hypothetical protein